MRARGRRAGAVGAARPAGLHVRRRRQRLEERADAGPERREAHAPPRRVRAQRGPRARAAAAEALAERELPERAPRLVVVAGVVGSPGLGRRVEAREERSERVELVALGGAVERVRAEPRREAARPDGRRVEAARLAQVPHGQDAVERVGGRRGRRLARRLRPFQLHDVVRDRRAAGRRRLRERGAVGDGLQDAAQPRDEAAVRGAFVSFGHVV